MKTHATPPNGKSHLPAFWVYRLQLHNMSPAVTVERLVTGNLAAMAYFFADDGFGNQIEVGVVEVCEYLWSGDPWGDLNRSAGQK